MCVCVCVCADDKADTKPKPKAKFSPLSLFLAVSKALPHWASITYGLGDQVSPYTHRYGFSYVLLAIQYGVQGLASLGVYHIRSG